MRSLTQKIIDVVCFIGGTIIFSHTLFSFNNSSREGGSYYYTDLQETLLAIGISLIVLGFLIRSWRKNNS